MNAMDVALICKALGDANRLEIVQMLSDGEKCGCKLLERFEITQPTLSHHMKILVGCGLVNDRKEGKWHHYSLNCETLMNYKHFIESLTCLGLNSTPFVRQYDIMFNRWGDFNAKGSTKQTIYAGVQENGCRNHEKRTSEYPCNDAGIWN